MLFGCAILILCFRLHGLDLALDSDEGDYAHVAQRLLAGDRLYVDVFDNKPPAVHGTFALAQWLFGDTDHSIRWLGIIASLASLAAVTACARQVFTAGTALWVAVLFCFLNVEPRSHSHITKIELFTTPFLLAALALALRYLATRRLLWISLAGLCVGVATSFKPWFMFHVPLLMLVAWRGLEPADASAGVLWRGRLWRWVAIGAAAALPGLITLGWLLAQGNMSAAWEALVVYNSNLARSEMPSANPLVHWSRQAVELATGDSLRSMLLPLWWVGIVFAFLLALRRDKPGRQGWQLLGGWTVLMLLEVTSGPRLSTYYFGPLLPLVAMTTVCGIELLTARKIVGWYALNALLGLLILVHTVRDYLLLNDSEINRAMWGHDVYKDFRTLGRQLRVIVPPNEQIYMWGFDTINYYSQRRSGSRYHCVWPGSFTARMMEQLVEDVIRNRPMVFYENHAYPQMPPRLKQFLQENYVPVAEAGLFTLNVLKEKHGLWNEGLRRFDEQQAAGAARTR